MKTGLMIGAAALAVIAVAGTVYMVDVEQTEEARLPDVDVSVEGGQMPAFETSVGDIEVVEETMTVTVPEVDVTTREEIVTVPSLDIQTPDEDSRSADSREDGTGDMGDRAVR